MLIKPGLFFILFQKQMSDTTAMASTEPPPKKRRTYDPSPPPPPQSPPPPPPPPSSSSESQPPVTQSNTIAHATTLTPDKMQKQRNQEDIRNLYESYKQLKYCISQKDANLMPELERAYLFLITSSRDTAAMASMELPPKKRQSYREQPLLTPSPPPSEPQPPETQTNTNAPPPATTLTLAAEKFAQEKRDQIEKNEFYESYEQLKYCISKKDANLMPELEQAYLSLITAFRGCISVQRLVAEFVPKYSKYCPTALEAAAKVCINIHNSSMAAINRGEDVENFSFGTASLCIVGLATICQSASQELPSSCVVQGICSTVFLNILDFFISLLEGQEILQVVNKDVVKIYDCPNTSELKKKFPHDDDAPAVTLSKCRALCILWIFFKCPRNTLEACFELSRSDSTDAGPNGGLYFLNQVTTRLDTGDGQVSIDNILPEDASSGSKSSLLSLVLDKDPSLRPWIFSRVNSIMKSASPDVVSAITSAFERIFTSFTEQVKAQEKQVDGNNDVFSPSKRINRQFSVHRNPSDADDQLSVLHLEQDIRSKTSPNNSGGPKSMNVDSVDHRESSRARSSTPNTVRVSSSTPNVDSHASRVENGVPLNVSSGGVNQSFESPKHHFLSWHCDGDRAAMDVYSASRHIWLGSLGPEASEPLVRFQFERFGPIDKLLYVPFKGFAVVEYKYIMDAIKAREVMRGRSLWGACLLIKFLDVGLGTRGDNHGMPVGFCCHVYVGNIYSQSDKDEVLYELRKVLFKGPLAVNDLLSEGALLMEFGTPEEAATVMAHLRQYRKEKRDFFQSPSVGPLHADSRNNNLGIGIGSSPRAQTMVGFSHYGTHNTNPMELNSPRMNMVNQGATMQNGYPFQAGGHIASGAPEQNWTYGNPESVPHSTPIHGHNHAPPQPMQSSSYMRPMYYPPNSSWDAHGMIHHMPSNPHNHAVAPPFLPASVTPLSQIQGNPLTHHDQMFYGPPQPHMPPSLPPQQNMLPPHPSLPPPLPIHPELPPPLPPSPPMLESQPPPPPPPLESSLAGGRGYWQGTLSKSGVHYSTIHARRLQSDACDYSDNNISEPAEWPTKLDITKRTDFKHVMSTFSSTPPHKREVCQLLPTSAGDHKGFQDFISYLKQRECAGVIKIPATKTIWARLLFILPYSNETCSHLSVAPDTADCLIGLVLPKETNFEWV